MWWIIQNLSDSLRHRLSPLPGACVHTRGEEPLWKDQALLHVEMAGTGHCLLPILSWK